MIRQCISQICIDHYSKLSSVQVLTLRRYIKASTYKSIVTDDALQQIVNKLKTTSNLLNEDWHSSFKDLQSDSTLTHQSTRRIAFRLLRCFSSEGMFVEGTSLMNFLTENYPKVASNPGIIASYLRLCAEVSCRFPKAEAEIEKWIPNLDLSLPYDLQTASDILEGISVTRNWKQRSHYILSSLKAGKQAYDSTQLTRICIPLLASAVRSGAEAEFRNMLQQCFEVATSCNSTTEFNSIISNATLTITSSLVQSNDNPLLRTFLAILVKELESLSAHGSGMVLLHEGAAISLCSTILALKPFGLTKCFPHVETLISSKSGTCRACSNVFPKLNVSNKSFNLLRNKFQKYAFLNASSAESSGPNDTSFKFLRTNPKEFWKFQKFLDRFAPFDVIIDGLNVSHRQSGYHFYGQKGQIVLNLAQFYACTHQKRVLIVAKKHIERSWSSVILSSIRRLEPTVKLFLSDNLSDDDALMINAALCSGPNSRIISHDGFRQPTAILPVDGNTSSPLRPTFRRWLASVHVIFLWWDNNLRMPIVQEPRNCAVGVTHTSKTVGNHEEMYFHIPFEEEKNQEIPKTTGSDTRLAPTKLFCLKAIRPISQMPIP